MKESKDKNHRTVRQEDKEIRVIRSCGIFQRNFIGLNRGGGQYDIHRHDLEP